MSLRKTEILNISSNPFFRPLLWPTVFVIAALPILMGLGAWQLQRLDWKLGILAAMEERLSAPAIDMANRTPAPDDEYRRYRVTGKFLPDVEFHWLTVSDKYGISYEIFSPFKLEDGRSVIVNRGIVPAALKDPAARPPVEAIGTTISFEAIARVSQTPGPLDAENDIAANIWFTRDIVAMIGRAGEGSYMPLYLERDGQVAEGDWPKPDVAGVTLVNNHLDYALTWFGLGVVLVAIYLAFHKAQGRFGRPPSGSTN
jgi:surfeit locus 1 family protein